MLTGPGTGDPSAGGAASGPGHARTGCGVIDRYNGLQSLPESASAWAARPTAHPPMMAPAKAILAPLIAEVMSAVRCGSVISGCCSLLYGPRYPGFGKRSASFTVRSPHGLDSGGCWVLPDIMWLIGISPMRVAPARTRTRTPKLLDRLAPLAFRFDSTDPPCFGVTGTSRPTWSSIH